MAANRSVVVTGASTGIGWGYSQVLVPRAFQVFRTVRKHTEADRLANEFRRAFTPLLMHVTDHAAASRIRPSCESRNRTSWPLNARPDTFKARVSFDDPLKSALRWRPDRIIVGEVRGT